MLAMRSRHFLTRKREAITAAIAGVLLLASIFILWVTSLQLPDLGSFENRLINQSTKIYDRTGSVLLYDINQGTRRTMVKSSDISVNIKNATVAIEDAEFYQHHGIKFSAILRAAFANLFSGSYTQGGSTITQQVIKNALLTSDKSIARKLKEWILSLKLERVMTKDEILTTYLNDTPYGGNIYGVEEAAMSFFGKHASEVSLAEATYLAALPNAPTYYSPYGGNRSALETRKNLVLEQMLKNSFITGEEYDAAKATQVKFNPPKDTGIKAPHFVMDIKAELEKQYGQEVMESSGFKVITTLDYNLQAKAEEIAKRWAIQNEQNFNASNAAITAIDATNGDILVMVGSRDYFDQNIDGNFNVATAHRQPGSSIKPVIYAEAIQKGYTPETTVFDVPTEFSTLCKPDGTPIKLEDRDKCYMPENYDGEYRGPISFRNALAQSVNVASIKVLYLAGIRDSISLANDMGIESLNDPDRYGLTLVLGGGEVTLLELTGAYTVLANNGVRNTPHDILKIEDAGGATIYSYTPEPKQVLPPNVAKTITDILSDNKAREPLYGLNSPLYFPDYDVAVKTGTTNDYRDAWTIGYTPQVAVGAWAGNNDNSSMAKKVSGYIVAPMWNEFMKVVLQSEPLTHFQKPDIDPDYQSLKPVLRGIWQGGKTYFIDTRTGNLASQTTPDQYKKEKVVSNPHEILFWVDKNNPRGPAPAHPEDDPQYLLWETPVQKWLAENYVYSPPPTTAPPKATPGQPAAIQPLKVTFTAPDQRIKLASNKITAEISTSGSYPVLSADYYINGEFIASVVKPPFSFSFVPKELSVIQKYNNIRVVVYDSATNRAEATTAFVVNF
jgi:1A family penicillin-binding protein